MKNEFKNIFRVFLLDAKRLSTNVVAIVIVMGLSIIPALYAWFNILSNWDPYGKNATSQMQIAVYSEDTGVTVGKVSVNIGDKVITSLESNDTIGWVFTDTKDDALAGVYSGDYYAAFIIPEEFTMDMISFLSGDPEHPQIEYYENSKKNAIATKITGKVKTTIQQSVNTAFVSAIAEAISKTSGTITSDSEDGTDLVSALVTELKTIDEDLTTSISIMNGFILITDSTGGIVSTSKDTLPDIEKMIDSGVVGIDSMKSTITSGAQVATTTMTAVNLLLNEMDRKLSDLSKELALVSPAVKEIMELVQGDVKTYIEGFQDTMDTLKTTIDAYATVNTTFAASDAYKNFVKDYDQFNTDAQKLYDDSDKTTDDVSKLCDELGTQLDYISADLSAIRVSVNKTTPNVNESVNKVQESLTEAERTLLGLDDDFIQTSEALQSYSDTLSGAEESFTKSKTYAEEMQVELEKIIDNMEKISEDETYEELVEALQEDPELVAEYVTSPVVMDTETMYEIDGYGSAMSPFYTTLALWVGALIMVALIKVKVQREGLEMIRPHHAFFGRFITFYLISQAQALITVLGDLLFVGIQCVHPFLFWLAASMISFTFMMIMYSLTVSFGNVGEAAAVVIMVIQVAGAGCTFPIEVLPSVFGAIYKFLPFVYSMNALKACVGGIYKYEYWYNLGMLAIFSLIFMAIGVFLRKPFEKLNMMIEHSKEKSGVMM